MAEELFEGDSYTLTDEEGNESTYELLGSTEIDGTTYLALVPVDKSDEYVILKREVAEDGEELLVTIEDDDEFDKVAEYFDDELFAEVDYDENKEEEQ